MGVFSIWLYITSGSILMLVSAIIAGVFGEIFTKIINKMLIVQPEGKMFASFESPPVPVHLDFYFFNVTNSLLVLHYGEKPILKELGPYSYHEIIERKKFSWYPSDGTVNYHEIRTYSFDPENSVGNENDKITTINAIMVIAASLGYENKIISKLVWPEIESGFDLFQTFTVKELLFDGWDLPYFNFDFSHVGEDFGVNKTANISGTLYEILNEFTGAAPEALKANKFGFYMWKNGTLYGDFRVKTGELGMDDYLLIQEFNNQTELSFWNDKYCDMINGTDGTQFPPNVKREDVLPIFTMDLCRSLILEYEKDVSLYGTLDTYLFVVPKEMLESPTTNPDNECFCVPVPMEEGCLGNGILNVAPCFKGAPILISLPHFYQGEEENINSVDGLSPSKEKHETFLEIEPKTGVVINAAKRIQMNVPLKRYGNLPSFKNVPELIFPILWANENAKISRDQAVQFHQSLTLPFMLTYIFMGLIFFAGIILASIGGVRYSKEKEAGKLFR